MRQNEAMRIIVDIPDALYRGLKSEAARERRSVKDLILRAIEDEVNHSRRSRRVSLPVVTSKHPGTLDIDNEKISEIAPFP